MNLHQPPLFTPPRPHIPPQSLGVFQFFSTLRRNSLSIWPKEAYEKDLVSGSFLHRKRFLLNGPQGIHRVLVENVSNYTRSAASIRILRPLIGRGLLLSEGEEWQHQRRTIAPALAPRVMPVLAVHIAAAARDSIAHLAAATGPVDMLAAMHFLALEIAGRSMFSLEMRGHGAALRALIAQFVFGLARPHFFDLMLPPDFVTFRDLARRRFRKRWLALMDAVIDQRREDGEGDNPRDLFDMLRAARDPETGAAFSREQLRDQVSTMIVAGHETTALTLFWSLYLLASAPAEQDRVAEEVRGLDFTPAMAMNAVPKLNYTRAVVNEALRLYPPAHAIVRRARERDETEGIVIPQGAIVMISPWILHRHVKLWEEADAFNPSRFVIGQPAHRYAYLPFGTGPRVCVGAQFALTEAALVLAMLLQAFEISLADDQPVLPVGVVTTQPDHPAPFRLKPRT